MIITIKVDIATTRTSVFCCRQFVISSAAVESDSNNGDDNYNELAGYNEVFFKNNDTYV